MAKIDHPAADPLGSSHFFRDDFKYLHDNPYHHRLGEFQNFVFRDDEAEIKRGHWAPAVFHNNLPLDVEIGCGFGEFMRHYCSSSTERNFVGLDYRFKRGFHLARKLNQLENKNFRFLRGRGERIRFLFGPEEVSRLFCFFPDPWPKKRHWKKRLIQPSFLRDAHQILGPGGKLYIKTDHGEYFDWMREALEAAQNESRYKVLLISDNLCGDLDQLDSDADRNLLAFKTKFEKIFQKQEQTTKAIILQKQ